MKTLLLIIALITTLFACSNQKETEPMPPFVGYYPDGSGFFTQADVDSGHVILTPGHLIKRDSAETTMTFIGGGIVAPSPPFVGRWNICIGYHAGYSLTTESYCVIIGEDSVARNIKGSDFIWYVDYNCGYLKSNPELTKVLREIEDDPDFCNQNICQHRIYVEQIKGFLDYDYYK